MQTINMTFAAGQTVKYTDLGNFVRVMAATAPLTVRVYKNSAVITESVGVGAGFAEKYTDTFDAIEFYSATVQTVQLVVRLGSEVRFDAPPTGNVNINNVNGIFTEGQASVTNANQAIIAANAARRSLIIQNNDASAVLRVTLDGAAATATRGFRILAGQMLDLSAFGVAGAINCIMETATAAANNVEFASA